MARLRRARERRRRLRIAVAVGVAVLVVATLAVAAVADLGGGSSAPRDAVSDAAASVTTEAGPMTATTDGVQTTTTSAAAGAGAAGPPTTRKPPPRPATTVVLGTVTTSATATKPVTASGNVDGAVVVVDPGHQGKGDSAQEPIGPGSSTTKDKVSSGASGVSSGSPESAINLAIALKLRDALQARGITVVMTRTSQGVDISNVQRTTIANEAHAALYIRVHADSADSSSTHGIHTLYPAVTPGWTDDIAAASKRAAQLAQSALIAATGATDRGLDARSDMTGFNWSDVPVIIPELGFMSNPGEDRLLNSASYQQKIADALADAAVRFVQEQRGG